MDIGRTINTAYGPRLAVEMPMVRLSLNPRETDLLAKALRHEAEEALASGHIEAFDRLHTRATAILEAGRLSTCRFRDIKPAPRHSSVFAR